MQSSDKSVRSSDNLEKGFGLKLNPKFSRAEFRFPLEIEAQKRSAQIQARRFNFTTRLGLWLRLTLRFSWVDGQIGERGSNLSLSLSIILNPKPKPEPTLCRICLIEREFDLNPKFEAQA